MADGEFVALEGRQAEYLKKLSDRLVGRKIEVISYVKSGGMKFPFIGLDDGSGIWIQQDDEGNGPGVAVHVPIDGDEMAMYEIR